MYIFHCYLCSWCHRHSFSGFTSQTYTIEAFEKRARLDALYRTSSSHQSRQSTIVIIYSPLSQQREHTSSSLHNTDSIQWDNCLEVIILLTSINDVFLTKVIIGTQHPLWIISAISLKNGKHQYHITASWKDSGFTGRIFQSISSRFLWIVT